MRTTLTLDDDVVAKLNEYARWKRLSFKEAVNTVLRRGLVAPESRRPRTQRFRVDVFDSPFRPGVDPLRLNQLSDDLEVEEASARRGFTQTCVQPLDPGPRHLTIVRTLFTATNVGGQLTTDPHLAAIAIEHQCELHSNDNDFERFPGLRWRNPIRDA